MKRKAYATLSRKTGFSESTIQRTVQEYERTGTVISPNMKRHCSSSIQNVSEFERTAIRRKVHEFYLSKTTPTIAKILQAVNNDKDLPNFKQTTFWKLLKELNFEFVERRRNSVLTEREDLILWR